jgi:hypothetical protein
MALEHDRLVGFLHKFVGDLGATMAAVSVVIGDRLGFYRALAPGPLSAADLAARTGTAPRYVEEWLRAQAANGYVACDGEAGTYWLTAEQAFALTDPDGAMYVPGAFQLALTTLRSIPQITQAFRTGSPADADEGDLATGSPPTGSPASQIPTTEIPTTEIPTTEIPTTEAVCDRTW